MAGDAAIFVKEDDVAGMVAAMREMQKPEIREKMIAAGLAQAAKFSWKKTADGVKNVLLEVAQARRE